MIVTLIQFSLNLSKKKSFLLTGIDSFLYEILNLFSIELLVSTLFRYRGLDKEGDEKMEKVKGEPLLSTRPRHRKVLKTKR